MNIAEQIDIMKFEARLANRAGGEGIRNWTPEARAASLAKRRAAGSVWGWNKRQRAETSPAFDASIDTMTSDAEEIRRAIASQKAGIPVLIAPSAGSAQVASQRLEEFKAWLSGVQRTQNAIDDFNGIVAAAGGMMGVIGAKRGQRVGDVTGDAASKSIRRNDEKSDKRADRLWKGSEAGYPEVPANAQEIQQKYYEMEQADLVASRPRFPTPLEKSIRRQFEKNGGSYARDPQGRDAMMDMVAEKAEYYSASPARKVEIEKNAYRQIRDYGSVTMREAPASQGADYSKLLEAKRSFVREREAVRPQLQADEVAYPAGNGVWIGRLPNGDERVISSVPESGWLYNRAHSAKCAASSGSDCSCSCGGSQHGGGTGTKLTAVTDDGKRKSAGGTRADGTSFYASVGEDIGDGTTVVSVDVAGEKIRVKDKDGNEYDLAIGGGEAAPAEEVLDDNTPYLDKDGNWSKEERRRNKLGESFQEVFDKLIHDDKGDMINEDVLDAIESYMERGALGMNQNDRGSIAEIIADSDVNIPEIKELQKELEASLEVFFEVRKELSSAVDEKAISLKDCADQLKKDGDKESYQMTIDALGQIYLGATREACIKKYGTSEVSDAQWAAVQKEINVPADMDVQQPVQRDDEGEDGKGTANRWSDAARAAALIVRRAKASARRASVGVASGSASGSTGIEVVSSVATPASTGGTGTGKSMSDYKKLGLSGMDSDWAMKAVRRIEEKQSWGKKVTSDEARFVKEYNEQADAENKASGVSDPKRPYSLSANLKAAAEARRQAETEKTTSEGSGDFDKLVTGFKKLISQGSGITSRNLQNQLLKDHDQEKFKLAKEALAEAWHTSSLDQFQNKFGRDPNNNAEFRKFQKSIDVPVEYIGAGEKK